MDNRHGNTVQGQSDRVVYAELLRITAVVFMIILHVSSGSYWNSIPVDSGTWQVLHVYNSLSRFCVPVFVMLSGMFLLDTRRRLTLSDIYRKYIFRIVTAFIFWSASYAVIFNLLALRPSSGSFAKAVLRDFITGYYHLWFLYMIAGLYIIMPFIRAMLAKASDNLVLYFLLLWAVFSGVIPTLLKLHPSALAAELLHKMDLQFLLGYVGYFVAGYYFKNLCLTPRAELLIYVCGGLGLLCTIVFTDMLSLAQGRANAIFYSYFAPNVMLTSIAIFVFFKERISTIHWSDKSLRRIRAGSSYTFGVYLIHVYFKFLLAYLGLTPLTMNAVIAVPLITAIVFVLSLAAVYLMGKVRILRKYIL